MDSKKKGTVTLFLVFLTVLFGSDLYLLNEKLRKQPLFRKFSI